MRESNDRVQAALYGDDPTEQVVVARLVEDPAAYRSWESEHSGLMREVATQGRRTQAAVLKKTAIRLIHGKALFEYLRQGKIQGSSRQRIVESFHPASDYARSVVSEHKLYVRKACSFLCTTHVGSNVVQDPGFFDPLQRYQELYAEYFEIFCNAQHGVADSDLELQSSLLPLLKHQLEECRVAIMNPEPAKEWVKREATLRSSSGDTVRMRKLPLKP